MAKRKVLGKGLSAMIPDADMNDDIYFQCPIESIEPNPLQPRQEFGESELEELVNSVREQGVITPLLVSKSEKGYRLIAGERRWIAAGKAGLKTVPVVVREATPAESLELALIENIHRKDLNPIEEALAYQRMLEDGHATQDSLAKRVGKERSSIANMLRLLTLPQSLQKDLIDKRMSMGHARVLAGLKDADQQRKLGDLIIKRQLSVRQAEQLLKRERKKGAGKKTEESKDYYFRSLEDNLKRSLGTKVAIRKKGRNGTIQIYFYSDEELDRLLEFLT